MKTPFAKFLVARLFSLLLANLPLCSTLANTHDTLPGIMNPPGTATQTAAGNLHELASLLERAQLALGENKNEQALELLAEAFELAHQAGNEHALVVILTVIANIYFETAQFEAASRYYSDALEVDSDDQYTRATLLFNRGHANGALGRYALANRDFSQSLEISRSLGDSYGQAYALKALGANAQAMEMADKAYQYFSMAQDIFQDAGDNAQITHLNRHLADLALDKGDFPEAATRYTQTLEEYDKSGDQTGMMRAYRGMSSVLALQGEFEKALNAYKAYAGLAIALAQEQGNETTRQLQVAFDTEHYIKNNQQLASLTRMQQETLDYQVSLLDKNRLAITLAACVVLLIGTLLFRTRQFAKKMQILATTDELTGLLSRRAILAYAYTEFERATRFARPLSCMILDIDHFKSINDTFGHEAGDKVLKQVSGVISSTLRKSDYFGRIGGEEFLLIAPETTPDQASFLSERIRRRVAETPFANLGKMTVTISAGQVQLDGQKTWEELMGNADMALYQAKQSGRNLVKAFQ